MTKTDRDSVERLADTWAKRGYVSPPRVPEDYAAHCTCKEATETADTLRALLDRIGFLEADFDDCNSERARWKARAEQAEAKLADVWDEALREAAKIADGEGIGNSAEPAIVNTIRYHIHTPYRSEENDTE